VTEEPKWWAGYVWWGVLIVAIAFGFGRSVRSYFVGDDFAYVGKFLGTSILSLPRFFVHEWSEGMWGAPLLELRPVAALSFILDGQLWGANPTGYHLTNLLLHLACSGLVMLITRAVLIDGWLPAAAAGLIFALHPVHVEPVIWITGRVDTISTLAYLLAIYGLLRFRSNATWYWLAVSWLAYGVGIFAKEAALTLPLMALLCEIFHVPKTARWTMARAVAPYLGWGAIALVYYYCRTTAVGSGLGAPAIPYGTLGFWQGAAQRQLYYLGQLFWPAQRALSFADAERARALPIWLMLLVTIITLSILWLALDRHRTTREPRVGVFFGVVWFLTATIPLLITYPSARHLYLASAGVAVGLSAVFTRLLGQRVAFATVMAILVVACGWQLRIAEGPWRGAARLSKEVSVSIEQVADKASPGDLLLLSVPERNEAAFIWSWASPFALRPPFQRRDLTQDFVVLEREPVYFFPGKWSEHPSFARMREHVGAAWIVSAMPWEKVKINSVAPARVASVLAQPDLNLGAPGSFERLIAGLTDKQSQ
jgi:hypothetical protein